MQESQQDSVHTTSSSKEHDTSSSNEASDEQLNGKPLLSDENGPMLDHLQVAATQLLKAPVSQLEHPPLVQLESTIITSSTESKPSGQVDDKQPPPTTVGEDKAMVRLIPVPDLPSLPPPREPSVDDAKALKDLDTSYEKERSSTK